MISDNFSIQFQNFKIEDARFFARGKRRYGKINPLWYKVVVVEENVTESSIEFWINKNLPEAIWTIYKISKDQNIFVISFENITHATMFKLQYEKDNNI